LAKGGVLVEEIVQLKVYNYNLAVDTIRILGVGGSSVVLIGDTAAIHASSIFDTPPESLIIGPLVPFAPESA
jgi:spore germination protein PD